MEENIKIAVRVNSIRYFDSREEAREYARKLLEAGLTYLKIEDKDDC